MMLIISLVACMNNSFSEHNQDIMADSIENSKQSLYNKCSEESKNKIPSITTNPDYYKDTRDNTDVNSHKNNEATNAGKEEDKEYIDIIKNIINNHNEILDETKEKLDYNDLICTDDNNSYIPSVLEEIKLLNSSDTNLLDINLLKIVNDENKRQSALISTINDKKNINFENFNDVETETNKNLEGKDFCKYLIADMDRKNEERNKKTKIINYNDNVSLSGEANMHDYVDRKPEINNTEKKKKYKKRYNQRKKNTNDKKTDNTNIVPKEPTGKRKQYKTRYFYNRNLVNNYTNGNADPYQFSEPYREYDNYSDSYYSNNYHEPESYGRTYEPTNQNIQTETSAANNGEFYDVNKLQGESLKLYLRNVPEKDDYQKIAERRRINESFDSILRIKMKEKAKLNENKYLLNNKYTSIDKSNNIQSLEVLKDTEPVINKVDYTLNQPRVIETQSKHTVGIQDKSNTLYTTKNLQTSDYELILDNLIRKKELEENSEKNIITKDSKAIKQEELLENKEYLDLYNQLRELDKCMYNIVESENNDQSCSINDPSIVNANQSILDADNNPNTSIASRKNSIQSTNNQLIESSLKQIVLNENSIDEHNSNTLNQICSTTKKESKIDINGTSSKNKDEQLVEDTKNLAVPEFKLSLTETNTNNINNEQTLEIPADNNICKSNITANELEKSRLDINNQKDNVINSQFNSVTSNDNEIQTQVLVNLDSLKIKGNESKITYKEPLPKDETSENSKDDVKSETVSTSNSNLKMITVVIASILILSFGGVLIYYLFKSVH